MTLAIVNFTCGWYIDISTSNKSIAATSSSVIIVFLFFNIRQINDERGSYTNWLGIVCYRIIEYILMNIERVKYDRKSFDLMYTNVNYHERLPDAFTFNQQKLCQSTQKWEKYFIYLHSFYLLLSKKWKNCYHSYGN